GRDAAVIRRATARAFLHTKYAAIASTYDGRFAINRCTTPSMNVDTIFPRLPAIFALTISFLTSAHAGNATWDQAPTSGDWNTAGNWTPSTVPDGPTDIAAFGTSVQTSVSLSQPIAIGAIIFNAGASAYTITYETKFVFDGAGIINNSGVTQNIVIGPIANPGVTFFNNSASAGISTVFTNSGSILFNNTSTAGQAT